MDNRALLAGVGIGAALAYVLDPEGGGRRRALVRDKLVWAARKTRDGMDATARDVAHRTGGIAAATRGRLMDRLMDRQIDDMTLLERVRARLGRVCSHPHAIDVEARGGEVTLHGPILSGEVDTVLKAVSAVRGVSAVINALEPHDSSEGVPSLQGRGRVAGPTLDILQRRWAPATRALVGMTAIAASGLLMSAYARR
jgi:hypothetical protein